MLALDLHDHHYNRVEVERIMSERSVSGLIVEYTNEHVTVDGGRHLKLQIRFTGTLGEFNSLTENDLVLLNELGHPGSGVYRIGPGDDWTDDWGYLIVGDVSAAMYHLENRIPGNFVIAG